MKYEVIYPHKSVGLNTYDELVISITLNSAFNGDFNILKDSLGKLTKGQGLRLGYDCEVYKL